MPTMADPIRATDLPQFKVRLPQNVIDAFEQAIEVHGQTNTEACKRLMATFAQLDSVVQQWLLRLPNVKPEDVIFALARDYAGQHVFKGSNGDGKAGGTRTDGPRAPGLDVIDDGSTPTD